MLIKPQKQFTLWLIGLWVACFAASSSLAQTVGNCGTLSSEGQYGPYDYRGDPNKLSLVTGAHFTPEVEALIRGKTGARPGGDIDYTLRAIPNNHRALMAMMRLAEVEKNPKPNGSRYTIECWFERAVLFRPDDSIVRMIFSTYLSKNGRLTEANAQLESAVAYAKDNGFTHYNIGLHYFDLKNYEKALVQAHKALELGFPQTALRDQLQSAGKWSEPVLAVAPPAEATSAPAQPTN